MESKGYGLAVLHGLDLVAMFLFRQVGGLRSCAKVAARHFYQTCLSPIQLAQRQNSDKSLLYKYTNFHLCPSTVKSDLWNSQWRHLLDTCHVNEPIFEYLGLFTLSLINKFSHFIASMSPDHLSKSPGALGFLILKKQLWEVGSICFLFMGRLSTSDLQFCI